MRPFARYVQELHSHPKTYADILFLGRCDHKMGASVTAGPDVRYSVIEPIAF